MVLFTVSVVNSVKYLRNPIMKYDYYATEYARTGLVFGILGLITGAIWANFQWGAPWSSDPKQNGAAIAILIYFAYFVLKGSLTDEEKQARIGAVYNIFAFFMLFPTIWILPRLVESLHPGGQGGGGELEASGGLEGNEAALESRVRGEDTLDERVGGGLGEGSLPGGLEVVLADGAAVELHLPELESVGDGVGLGDEVGDLVPAEA